MPRKKPNKSAFIRALPHSMPASEVVTKGKAAGLAFSDKYVWAIRAKQPKRGRPKGSGKGLQNGKSNGSAETQFAELALNVGLERAEALLAKVRAGIRAAIG